MKKIVHFFVSIRNFLGVFLGGEGRVLHSEIYS